MFRYFSNFGNKLQMMVGIGKECGFTSNLDMPGLFTGFQIGVTAKNGDQPITLPNALLYPRVDVKQLSIIFRLLLRK